LAITGIGPARLIRARLAVARVRASDADAHVLRPLDACVTRPTNRTIAAQRLVGAPVAVIVEAVAVRERPLAATCGADAETDDGGHWPTPAGARSNAGVGGDATVARDTGRWTRVPASRRSPIRGAVPNARIAFVYDPVAVVVQVITELRRTGVAVHVAGLAVIAVSEAILIAVYAEAARSVRAGAVLVDAITAALFSARKNGALIVVTVAAAIVAAPRAVAVAVVRWADLIAIVRPAGAVLVNPVAADLRGPGENPSIQVVAVLAGTLTPVLAPQGLARTREPIAIEVLVVRETVDVTAHAVLVDIVAADLRRAGVD
jgi:hypothetical protein